MKYFSNKKNTLYWYSWCLHAAPSEKWDLDKERASIESKDISLDQSHICPYCKEEISRKEIRVVIIDKDILESVNSTDGDDWYIKPEEDNWEDEDYHGGYGWEPEDNESNRFMWLG